MEYKDYKKLLDKNKNSKNSKYISNLFTRSLIAVIIVLASAIYMNISEKNLNFFKKNLFEKSLPFNKINMEYNKIFGSVMPIEINKGTTKTVFNDHLSYSNIEKFNDGFKLTLDNNIVTSLYDGIVVYIGNKDNYGNTVIIQGSDGVDIWYSNVDNVSVNLYDYVEKGSTMAETVDSNLILVFNKEDKYLGYEEYLK